MMQGHDDSDCLVVAADAHAKAAALSTDGVAGEFPSAKVLPIC